MKELRLTVLGSGTGLPFAHRGSPAYLVTDGNYVLLMDMGPGSLRQLARIGIRHSSINAVLITHFHPDHTCDLIHLLFATRHPPCLKHRKPFVIIGPPGFASFLTNLKKAYGHWLELPTNILQIHEIEPGETYSLSRDLFISSASTAHTKESISYCIETSYGKKLVYSGDTSLCEEIILLAKEADLLILESSFPDQSPIKGHLTPGQAGLIASKANVKKLLLSHFYPECLKIDIPTQCRKYYKGKLILSSDLITIRI